MEEQLVVSPRAKVTAVLVVILLVLIAFLIMGSSSYLEFLWYLQDARYPRVFLLSYQIESILFFVSFFPSWGLLRLAFRSVGQIPAVYDRVPQGLDKAWDAMLWILRRSSGTFGKVVSGILAFFIASSFAGSVNDYLLFSHAQRFGQADPIFGLDYSFFVFRLNWLNDVVGLVTTVLFMGALIAALGGVATFGFARLASIQIPELTIRRRVGLWLAVFGLVEALQLWLDVYSYGFMRGTQFVGPGYAGTVALNAQRGLVFVVVLLSIWIFLESRKPDGMKSLMVGLPATVGLWVLGVQMVPFVIQRVRVDPDKINVEKPFAARALAATRFGFDLNRIETRDVDVADAPTPKEVASASTTFSNMRLWDPEVMQQAAQGVQSFKPYYVFPDVDLDRYPIRQPDGSLKQQMLMIGARTIDPTGLNPSAQTWLNTRLVYTHGYGVVAAPVNQADSMGQPNFILKDIPVKTPPELPLQDPEIYFGEIPEAVSGTSYAIVNTKVDEFDYPGDQGNLLNRWKGTRGVDVDRLLPRLIASVALGDGNLLVSGNIKAGSRLLLHRQIRTRAKLIFPFLTFDRDPYITIIGGRLVWILDGYTTSDQIPCSDRVDFQGQEVSYVRNSVKVTINAYTGVTTAYETDSTDPILKAYEGIYPGLIHPLSDASAELRSHFRYPEALFNAQTAVLTTYHVNSATTFLDNGDAWAIPNERGLGGDSEPLPSYYVQMRLPDEPTDEFVLMRPFTAYGRDNMSGWLAAHCDPNDYGRLVLYRFGRGSLVLGPAQEETLFVQDRTIANINRQFNNDQSQVVIGNLLVIPVGNSIVYAEPLYLEGKTSGIAAIPELKKVILAIKGRIVVEDTYQEALAALFGTSPSAPAPVASGGAGSGSTESTAVKTPPAAPQAMLGDLRQANHLLDLADKALRGGDFATYGQLEKQAREILKKAIGTGSSQ